ncbi:Uncharacterised protein [Mesomycoplasma ovipneumoniae]|nr:Uncharacterised protein [Mesomycoplasma ovipneumoniae]
MVRFKIQCFSLIVIFSGFAKKVKKVPKTRHFSRVSQFDKVILKKHLVLGTFLSFSVKVNNNFFTDLLTHHSKNHTYFKYSDH